ncbi:TniQ family protein [Aphanothece hegewaldii]|nr:TniQ family protein [Aphanothece hegewaldii]
MMSVENTEELTIYESWDLYIPSVPTRSRLFPLLPVGIGTHYVESLTSYISRLAFTHSLRSGVLVEKEFSAFIDKQYGVAHLRQVSHASCAFNGTGAMAQDLVRILSHLTYRDDLHLLTLLPWSDILTSRNLLRSKRAWCPLCYKKWLDDGQSIYEPLLWSLSVINICPVHKIPLVSECQYCHHNSFLLTGRSQVGHCSRCEAWLGSHNNEQTSSTDDDLSSSILKNIDWEIWKTVNTGELLALSSKLAIFPSKEIIAKNLIIYARKITQGNLAVLARQLQIPKNTFWLWCQGKNQPTLEALLKICYCLKISLWDFLNADEIESDKGVVSLLVKSNNHKAKSRLFPVEQVKQSLEDILNDDEIPPPSLVDVATALNFDRRTIFRHFPDLCKAISVRYAQYEKALFCQKLEESCKEVQQVVIKLYQEGEYPTEARVSKLISRPGFLRYKKVREAFRNARRSLFIEP